jgi:ABC-type transport system involved in multi-copper enzyme maturation permease subunit
MKALVFKELREVAPIAVIALACYLALVANLMGAKVFSFIPWMPDGTHEVPFVGTEFITIYTPISCLFAVALGFRQSAIEASRGTFLFLLHRPLSRNAIVLTKMATGVGVFVVCASLPIIAYAWWAAIPGHHASPFEWSMTLPAWAVLLTLAPWFYFGSFLSGLRPARWVFGTRLLPLAAVPVMLLLIGQLALPAAVCLILFSAGFAAVATNICYVARVRDYA